MRWTLAVVVLFALAATVTLGSGERSPSDNRPPGARAQAAGELLALTAVYGNVQQVSVIDSRERTLAVYHLDLTTGQCELKSVRRIHWDLQIEDFEGKSPLPQEVRTMVERK
jgi:hypothetical protein